MLGRFPRFHQVVVKPDGVNALDGGLSIGVGGEQYFAGLRIQLDGLGEELGAGHLRHALVDEKQRQGVVAALQFLDGLQGLTPRAGLDDPVLAAEVLPQIALHGTEHLRVVVDREDDGFGQGPLSPRW